MVIYISGPMTGYENYNLNAFNNAEKTLKQLYPNHIFINPHKLVKPFLSSHEVKNEQDFYNQILAFELDLIRKKVGALVLLSGWEKSNGCNEEVGEAKKKNIPCYFYKNGKMKGKLYSILR